jgi:membrane-associated phospholipid phosphatase
MRRAGLVLLLTLPGAVARAQPSEPRELRLDVPIDATIAGVGLIALVLAETVLKDPLAPDACRWCEPPGLDVSVRNALVWDDTHGPEIGSAVTGFVLAPLAAYGTLALAAGLDDRLGESWENALVVTEAFAVTMLVTEIVKGLAGRQRPIAHFEGGGLEVGGAQEGNLSFFSGHSSLSFSLAVAAGTVASMREYRWAPLVWGTGLAIAALTAYLRIGADAHYFTDVLTGALVGSALGFAIPWLFHRPSE